MKKKDKKIVAYAVASVLAAHSILGCTLPQEVKENYNISEEDIYGKTGLTDYVENMRKSVKTKSKKRK